MKKRIVWVHSLLVVAVLFTMLFQSLHSIEHLSRQFDEKQCVHTHRSPHEITHQHHSYDHCLVCDFTLGNFVPSEAFHLSHYNELTALPYTFKVENAVIRTSLRAYLLRGPPSFIV